MDATGGLVTAAVAERMGGHGSIVVAHTGARADPSDIVDKFNFPATTKQKIVRHHINNLLQLLPGTHLACLPASKLDPCTAPWLAHALDLPTMRLLFRCICSGAVPGARGTMAFPAVVGWSSWHDADGIHGTITSTDDYGIMTRCPGSSARSR